LLIITLELNRIHEVIGEEISALIDVLPSELQFVNSLGEPLEFTSMNDFVNDMLQFKVFICAQIPEERFKLIRLRQNVIDEIISTEQDYITRLQALASPADNDTSQHPMSLIGQFFQTTHVLDDNTEVFLVGFFETIYKEHTKFLNELTFALSDAKFLSCLGPIFNKYYNLFSQYRHYVSNYPKISTAITLNKTKFPFSLQLEQLDKQLTVRVGASTPQTLDGSFLSIPFQRIPRYLLFLQRLYECTPS